jgi:nitroreductase/NAD-dependent dihydropyrimidine dehydrogenase PreA subunit
MEFMISINPEACTDCLDCYSVCPNLVFATATVPGHGPNVQVRYPEQCCACGHCIAVCPTGAISHPELPIEEFQPLPSLTVTPEAMQTLLRSRRSIRNYRPNPIPREVVTSLLTAATHAGTSSNGQTEGFILVEDQSFLRQLEELVVQVLWGAGLKHLGKDSPMRRLLGWKYGAEMVRQYQSYHGIFQHRREHDQVTGVIFRNAPLVLIAHGMRQNVLAGANCALAVRNVELMSLTMGLGTCWVGFLVAAAALSKRIGRLLKLPNDRRIHGALMIGYPAERYQCQIPRKPRQVTWI